MTIDEILKVIFGDDYDGDVDKYSVFENSHRTLKKEVKDKLEQKLNDGSLEDIFDKSYNGKRVLFIDEDGFLNQAQLEALTKYAKKYNKPIVKKSYLSKALYQINEGKQIPPSLYEAVAEILYEIEKI